MKRALISSGAAVVVVFAFCHEFMAPVKLSATQNLPAQEELIPKLAKREPAAGDSVGKTLNAALVAAAPRPMTIDRQRIYDAPDILAEVNQLRRTGSPDEKYRGASLMATCRVAFAKVATPVQETTVEEEAQSPPLKMDPALQDERNRARSAVEERCRGFKDMSSADYRALKKDMLDAVSDNGSMLMQLRTLTDTGDGRWNDEQTRFITNALYSGDPELSNTAFSTLLSAIDSQAPGGVDRMHGLMVALGPMYLTGAVSDFERLSACSSMGWCNKDARPSDDDYRPSPEVLRLADEYKSAAANHRDVKALIAIH